MSVSVVLFFAISFSATKLGVWSNFSLVGQGHSSWWVLLKVYLCACFGIFLLVLENVMNVNDHDRCFQYTWGSITCGVTIVGPVGLVCELHMRVKMVETADAPSNSTEL